MISVTTLHAVLQPIFKAMPNILPEAWVLASARELAGRCPKKPPERWLDKLSQALLPAAFEAPPRSLFATLPPALWLEPSFLGEVLLAARLAAVEARAKKRRGRADRISVGEVYTPAAVARRILASVRTGVQRVVDPACGAGVFLQEAFQSSFQRRRQGGAHAAEAAAEALAGDLAGIDLDPQALAVAEFSLRLAGLIHGGLDCDVPLDLRRADALQKLEGLEGGCECIVGNPPFIEGRGLDEAQFKHLRARFRCAGSGKINLCAVFVERALELLKDDGVLALVVPATFQRNARYRALREMLLEQTVEAILPLERACFERHIVETVILRVRKSPPRKNQVQVAGGSVPQSGLAVGPLLRFCERLSETGRLLLENMEQRGVPLEGHFEVRDGISTGFQPFPARLLGVFESGGGPAGDFVSLDGQRRPFDPKKHRRIIDGREFSAFSPVGWAGRFIEYDKRHEHCPPHPGRSFNCQLREASIYDRTEKLLTRQTARGLTATVDRQRYFVRNSVHVTFVKDFGGGRNLSLDALCACFNSRLYNRYLLVVSGENGMIFPQVHIADIKRLPILPELLQSDSPLERLGSKLLKLHEAPERNASEIAQLKEETEKILCEAFGFLLSAF